MHKIRGQRMKFNLNIFFQRRKTDKGGIATRKFLQVECFFFHFERCNNRNILYSIFNQSSVLQVHTLLIRKLKVTSNEGNRCLLSFLGGGDRGLWRFLHVFSSDELAYFIEEDDGQGNLHDDFPFKKR